MLINILEHLRSSLTEFLFGWMMHKQWTQRGQPDSKIFIGGYNSINLPTMNTYTREPHDGDKRDNLVMKEVDDVTRLKFMSKNAIWR